MPVDQTPRSDLGSPAQPANPPWITDTDSDNSSRGIWGELARRCCRRFKITVRRDFRLSDQLWAKVGCTLEVKNGDFHPFASVTYEINDKFGVQLGNDKVKARYRGTGTLLGKSVKWTPSLYIIPGKRAAGVQLKFTNIKMITGLASFVFRGSTTSRWSHTITSQSEETSGMDLSFKVAAKRDGVLPDAVVREIGTTIRLGPRVQTSKEVYEFPQTPRQPESKGAHEEPLGSGTAGSGGADVESSAENEESEMD